MPLERGFNMEHDPANQLPQVAAPRMETRLIKVAGMRVDCSKKGGCLLNLKRIKLSNSLKN